MNDFVGDQCILDLYLLRLAFLFLFFFLCLFQFFHQVTLTITVHLRFIPIDTQFFGNIVLICFKTQVHEQITAIRAKQTE